MRILHIITGLDTGGAEMMLLKLLTGTAAHHEQVVISAAGQGTIGPRISGLGIPVVCLGLRRSAPNPIRVFFLRSLLRRFRPQLIQGWMYHGNVLASLASVLSVDPSPVLWNIQQSLYDISKEPWLTARVIRLGVPLSRRTAAIIYNSRTSAGQHEAFGYSRARRIVIPSAFDCEMFRPREEARQQVRAELGLGGATLLVGLVNRYHPMKDHPGFLKAAGMVSRRHPNVRFALVGKGVVRENPVLAQLISEYQLHDRTFFLGERADMSRLTAAFDIACSASAWGEGFSNAIGEAMACEVPCVVTDVGDSAYAVGDTGLSVPPGDPHSFAEALSRLIEAGPEYRRQLGAAARQRVQENFSLQEVVRSYEDLYQRHGAGDSLANGHLG